MHVRLRRGRVLRRGELLALLFLLRPRLLRLRPRGPGFSLRLRGLRGLALLGRDRRRRVPGRALSLLLQRRLIARGLLLERSFLLPRSRERPERLELVLLRLQRLLHHLLLVLLAGVTLHRGGGGVEAVVEGHDLPARPRRNLVHLLLRVQHRDGRDHVVRRGPLGLRGTLGLRRGRRRVLLRRVLRRAIREVMLRREELVFLLVGRL